VPKDFLGHTVRTAKITAIGDGYPEITQGAVESVGDGQKGTSKFWCDSQMSQDHGIIPDTTPDDMDRNLALWELTWLGPGRYNQKTVVADNNGFLNYSKWCD
jgi:hypothetical protein